MKDALANVEKLKEIADGKLQGEGAVAALREALQEIYVAEAGIQEWRRLVSAAELRLIYGDAGRPQRFGSTFSEGAG